MSSVFDSHCHPQFAAYDQDREAVVQCAFGEGALMIAVGTSLETSRGAVELAKQYPGKIWATVGIHPHHVSSSPHDPLETQLPVISDQLSVQKLSELAKLSEVVAIGESGLDYYYVDREYDTNDPRMGRIKNAQRENFIEHIRLAKKVHKPLVVHARKAYTDILPILKSEGVGIVGVMHFFQGTPEEAKWFLDLGYYISFAGPITFADEYRAVVQYVPLDRILAETDAPYATPAPHRGKRNEPAYVKFVIKKITEIKGLTFDEAVKTITHNVEKLFRLPS